MVRTVTWPHPEKVYKIFAYLPTKTTTGWIWLEEFYHRVIYHRNGEWEDIYYETDEYLILKLRGDIK